MRILINTVQFSQIGRSFANPRTRKSDSVPAPIDMPHIRPLVDTTKEMSTVCHLTDAAVVVPPIHALIVGCHSPRGLGRRDRYINYVFQYASGVGHLAQKSMAYVYLSFQFFCGRL
jgi:hypothetical protein